MTFTNLFLPTDPLFLAILLVKQYIKLEWPYSAAIDELASDFEA